MNFTKTKQVLDFLYEQIPHTDNLKFPGENGLERTKYLLKLLGNPQDQLKVIHITGTSGKGSTAYLTSILLRAAKFKVGLHVSPFIQDIRESFQINNEYISEKEFIDSFNAIYPAIEKVKNSSYGRPSYFEIKTVLAFYIFLNKKVDYAVVEVGMGGLFDATNTVSRADKVGVITRIGLDHTAILGKTLAKIAYQKAMITQKGNVIFTGLQDRSPMRVIKKTVKNQKGKLIVITKGKEFNQVRVESNFTVFDYGRYRDFKLGLIGLFQAENASLALTVVDYLAKRDNFKLNELIIRKTLENARFLGRFDIREIKGGMVILDGAHNPQKMKAFITSLARMYPKEKYVFLIGFKKGKSYRAMLKYIVPVASKVILTTFRLDTQDMVHQGENPIFLKELLLKLGFKNIIIESDLQAAWQMLLKEVQGRRVVTGSLYLLSDIYKLF